MDPVPVFKQIGRGNAKVLADDLARTARWRKQPLKPGAKGLVTRHLHSFRERITDECNPVGALRHGLPGRAPIPLAIGAKFSAKFVALNQIIRVRPPLLAGLSLPRRDEYAVGVNPILGAPQQAE